MPARPPVPGTLPEPGQPEPTLTPEPIPEPTPPPEPVERRHSHPPSVKCGNCECEVTTTRGEVLRFSQRGRDMRDAGELQDKLKAEIETLKQTITELRARLQQSPQPTPSTSSSGGWSL